MSLEQALALNHPDAITSKNSFEDAIRAKNRFKNASKPVE
jgi:hypothetical protein